MVWPLLTGFIAQLNIASNSAKDSFQPSTSFNMAGIKCSDSDGVIDTVIDADEIFTAASVKATDLTAGQSISFLRAGGVAGGFISEGSSSHWLDAMDVVDRWIRAEVTTVGTVGTAGKTYVYVVYAIPEMDAGTFDAT